MVHIFTIGHSTRSAEELLSLLKQHGIEIVVDVRRFPSSGKFPHLNRESLERKFPEEGISYIHLGESLGGFRKETYRAYMRKDEFRRGVEQLLSISRRGRMAIMCAEILWFRCHRRYISDHLVKRGHTVTHIVDEKRTYEHRKRAEI